MRSQAPRYNERNKVVTVALDGSCSNSKAPPFSSWGNISPLASTALARSGCYSR